MVATKYIPPELGTMACFVLQSIEVGLLSSSINSSRIYPSVEHQFQSISDQPTRTAQDSLPKLFHTFFVSFVLYNVRIFHIHMKALATDRAFPENVKTSLVSTLSNAKHVAYQTIKVGLVLQRRATNETNEVPAALKHVLLRSTPFPMRRLEMGPLQATLQPRVPDRRNLRHETHHANGPSEPEMQALRKDRHETTPPSCRGGKDPPLEEGRGEI